MGASTPWWQSTTVSSLLGVIVGGAIAVIAEYYRRRWDRRRAESNARADARLARFATDESRSLAALDSVARTDADLSVANDLAASAQLTPEVAKTLTLSPDGIVDTDLSNSVARLAARLRVLAGLGNTDPATLAAVTASVTAEAAALLPDVRAELAARRSDLDALRLDGAREAQNEADSMRSH